MNDELERIWKEATMAFRDNYPGIFLNEPKKTMIIISQGSWCLSRDFNGLPPEYESRVLP
jgi:hypothetical protein